MCNFQKLILQLVESSGEKELVHIETHLDHTIQEIATWLTYGTEAPTKREVYSIITTTRFCDITILLETVGKPFIADYDSHKRWQFRPSRSQKHAWACNTGHSQRDKATNAEKHWKLC